MAERKQKPIWLRGYHPADTEKNFDMLFEVLEVLLPDYPEFVVDLEDSVEVTASADETFTIECETPERGALTYQWEFMKKGTTSYTNINGATSAAYTRNTWSAASHDGTYRCKVTNTFGELTAVVYSNECVAAEAEAA